MKGLMMLNPFNSDWDNRTIKFNQQPRTEVSRNSDQRIVFKKKKTKRVKTKYGKH